jgi:hypothetical protein
MKTQTQQKPAAGHSLLPTPQDIQQRRLADARARLQRVGVPTLGELIRQFGHWPVAEASGKVVSSKG